MPRSKDENACRRRRRRRRRTRAKIKIPPVLRNISCGVTLGRWREMRKEGTYTHTHIPHTHPTFFSPLHEQKTAISAHPNFIASLPFVIACVRRRLWIRSHTHTHISISHLSHARRFSSPYLGVDVKCGTVFLSLSRDGVSRMSQGRGRRHSSSIIFP